MIIWVSLSLSARRFNRIMVLKEGRVEQIGEPLALYGRPRNAFVVGIIGSPAINFVPL